MSIDIVVRVIASVLFLGLVALLVTRRRRTV
jgi:hypothetical protein